MTRNRCLTIICFALCCILAFITSSCTKTPKIKEVIVYVSVDQVFSEPVLKNFEKKTGIKVLPVYDVEAAKTTGLVNRLIAEKNNPKADVFWNNEFAQTIMLKEKGILAPYKSPSAAGIPAAYIDKDNCWTGFGGRARVLLVNKNMIKPEDYPKSIYDLVSDKYPANQIGIAYPIFGTTATHAAALYAAVGKEKGYAYFKSLKDRGVRVVDGNSVVRDMVVKGQLMMGMTDTDDSGTAIKKGKPVEMVFLDQGDSDMGTLINSNTVSKIKGCPHPREAEQLIDYLLSPEVEKELQESGWFDLSLRSNLSNKLNVKRMNVNLEEIYSFLEESKKDMTEIFVR